MGKDTQFVDGSDDNWDLNIDEMVENSGVIPPDLCEEMLAAKGLLRVPDLTALMGEVASCAQGENGDVVFHTRRRINRGFQPSDRAMRTLLRVGTGKFLCSPEEAARRLDSDLQS